MTAPKSDIYQMRIQNPHATMPLVLPVHVLCNTPDEELHRNIRENSSLAYKWVSFRPTHDDVAILVGGGPSLTESIGEIRGIREKGGIIFAMNGAATFLADHGIFADYQVIADAKPETATLVESRVGAHLIASQVARETIDRFLAPELDGPVFLWHLAIDDMEELFPEDRRKRGGYALVGGGASVGNSALCLAYVLGYRDMRCFGYDSSHREGNSHAYRQPMNDVIPTIDVEWAGKTYVSSVAMKAQAEKFQITAQLLRQQGCKITVHGNGLLPAMFNTPAGDLTERDKYRLMWQFDGYREFSPGKASVDLFLSVAEPNGLIVDFGCGTGKASIELHGRGYQVFLIDFADNCRDDEAKDLPFLEWDLTQPIPVRSPYGYCTDVLEHIPEKHADIVICNIMEAAETVFFQISTVQDTFGDVIGQRLHCTVRPHDWWQSVFRSYGHQILWQENTDNASCFLVKRNPSDGATQ